MFETLLFLVESPNRVRITDFGLAKLLDHQVEAFHSDGGKVCNLPL